MDTSPGMTAMLTQLAPVVGGFLQRVQPLFDQPIIRMPYAMPLATSQVIPAGAQNVRLEPTDFQYSFEYPFEVHEVKFSQDPAHTTRDWRVSLTDQTFMIAQLVDDNTGKWVWKFPWIVRPKGGGLTVTVDNLDTVNPITVDICFLGYQLIPR